MYGWGAVSDVYHCASSLLLVSNPDPPAQGRVESQTQTPWPWEGLSFKPRLALGRVEFQTPIPLALGRVEFQTTIPWPRERLSQTKGAGFETALLLVVWLLFSPQFFQEGASTPILTDDVSLQVFMEHLKKLAVSSST